MKIVYYSAHPNLMLNSPSGYGTHMREMIKAFERAGHEVTPIIMGDVKNTSEGGHVVSESQPKLVVKRMTPSFVWESMKDYLLLNKDLAYENYLKEKLVEIKPDLVYERANCLQLSGVHAARKFGIPHILEMNAPYVEERKDHFAISSLFERRASKIEKQQLMLTGSVIVVSEALKTYFLEKHKIAPEPFLVLPNAVDPEKVQAYEERVAEIVSRYNFDGKIVVGFVGSLFKWHGVDQLIRAVKLLRDAGFNIALLVVGDGAIKSELEHLSQSLQLGKHVVFTGSVPHKEVFNYIEAMDITVMANSNWYGSPVKLFEYGAMNKPVIAPSNGPVKEIIKSEVDGLLIENEFDLERHLRRLIEHPALREKLASSFNQKVLKEHTWERNAEKVLEKAGILTAMVH